MTNKKSSSAIQFDYSNPPTLKIMIPNKDTNLGYAQVCPKEVLQESYRRSVGREFTFKDKVMTILSVEVTDEHICLYLRPKQN